jgi:hypothetical protein
MILPKNDDGLNTSMFSVNNGNGVMEMISPKNGVKMRNAKLEIGHGRYIN